MIYLPKEDSYIAPYEISSRLGLIPDNFSATDAVFVREVEIRDFITPVIETKYIPAPLSTENQDNMDIEVTFSTENDLNEITLEREFSGYQANYIKSYWALMESDQKEELLKSLVKFMTADAEIEDMKFMNTDFNYKNWNEPIAIRSKFSSSSFIENAGNTILFKVGELIGPQSEMYQENERKLAIENQFNRSYDRNIMITIPKGYQVKNLEDLVIDKLVKNEKGEDLYAFKSFYKLENGKIQLSIFEFYNQLYFPRERYEEFRSVINAAADFNKIVLVLKPDN